MPDFPKSDKFSLSERAYVCQWLVQSDSYSDGPLVAQSCSGLPVAFSTYNFGGTEVDPYARLREWDAYRKEPNSLVWVVWARWSTPPLKEGERRGAGDGSHQDNPNSYTDPTQELPIAKTTMIEREKLMTRVFNLQTNLFNPPMNSACEPFNPPPSYKTYDLQLEITRNEVVSGIHPSLGIQYSSATNSDVFWGMAAGTWICKGIAAENQWRQIQGGTEFPYMRVTYTFQARAEGWTIYVLDAGDYYCKNGGAAGQGSTAYSGLEKASGKGPPSSCPACTPKTPFIDQNGHPIKGMLDGSGGRLPDGGTPVWMELVPYTSLPYAALSLPNTYGACG
jgi:hypothetical protein